MPILTRVQMHTEIDMTISKLNSYPTSILDPLVKDIFLNKVISLFINSEIDKTNKPDEVKRVPFRLLTYGDIINKYNNLYTLIKVDETLLPITKIDNNFFQYILPTDLVRFESSFCNVRPLDCITYPSATKPTLANSSGAGTVDAGIHKYFITFVYPTIETDVTGENVVTITVTTSKNVELTNIPLGLTGCTERKIYRSKLNDPWYKAYYVGTVAGNTTQVYTDSATDASLTILYTGNTHDTQLTNLLLDTYDIVSFNNNPFGGGRKYIGTIVDSNGLKLYHLQRYAISRVGVIYIKKPAIIANGVNCDLPDSIHTTIVENTIKYIITTVNNGSYQEVLNSSK